MAHEKKAFPSLDRSKYGDYFEMAVHEKLDRYFEQLEGAQPLPLFELVMDAVEKPLLVYALERCNWKQIEAARMLGINRNTLHKKLQHHRLMDLVHSQNEKERGV